jgi:Ca2+-transporting ATPase
MRMISWHALPIDEVAAALATDTERGLTTDAAAARLAEHGPNRLAAVGGHGTIHLLLEQLSSALVWLLLVAAAISGFLLGEWIDAGVIGAIVVLNTLLGFFQEARAERALTRLREMAAPEAVVVRGGHRLRVPAADLVPGDLIVLEAGVKIAADARVVDSAHLEVEQSSLTGESLPTFKQTDPVGAEGALGDRKSIVFSGTTVAAGRGTALVVGTGSDTEFGRIAGALAVDEPPTPLQVELDRVGKRLAVLALGTAGIVFLAGWSRGYSAETMFLTSVALAVAAIPEGLPAVVTITLAGGVQRMARRNAIVRRLPAVEALGAATVICTDKTGTLTRNTLRVVEVVVSGDRWAPDRVDGSDPRAQRFAEVASWCNDARPTSGGWIGDSTEVALLIAVSEVGADPEVLRASAPRVDEFAFDSRRKRMSTVHRVDGELVIAVKGAPEVVLGLVSWMEEADGLSAVSGEHRQGMLDQAAELAQRGLRTLALAYRHAAEAPEGSTAAERDLVLVGLVGMSDTVRPEAEPAVAQARLAGIDVVMVTGDHAVTASAIATELGILDGGDVMPGDRLRELDADALSEKVDRYQVFSRIDPLDKVKIVEAWRKRGAIVAMTGDGVNDAPALRAADIGVAMGSGTDVAKEAASIVLADDNFATIVAAVREGRTIFANLKRVVWYLLACNASEVLVMLIGFLVFGGLGDPLLATQLLWINLVTDGLPALALGVDPAAADVMRRPPEVARDVLGDWGRLLRRAAVLASSTLAALMIGHFVFDYEWPVVRTMVFSTLVLVQLGHAYEVRARVEGRGNRFLAWSLLVSAGLQALVIYTPFGHHLFETVSVPVVGLGVVGVLAVASFTIGTTLERVLSPRG